MITNIRTKVFEVAEELLREGKRPTQQLVRERIGSGSLTTINRGLNEWWAVLSQRLSKTEQDLDLPEPVIRLSQRLWTESIGYARREFLKRADERESEHEALKIKLLSEREEFSSKLKELNDQILKLQSTNAELEQRSNEIRVALQQSQDECYRLSSAYNRNSGESIVEQQFSEELLEARVRIRIQQEQIENIFAKNQSLISENADLKLRLKNR